MRKHNTKNKIKKRRSGKQLVRSGVGLTIPKEFNPRQIPQIESRPVTPYRWRYKFGSAAAVTVSGSVLLSSILMATSATATFRMLAAVRIKEVEMWGPFTTATGAAPADPFEMGLEWFGTTGSSNPSYKVTDIAMSGRPSHVIGRVPTFSFTEDWINQGGNFDNTNTIFAINAQEGTIVDIVIDTQLVDNEAASAGPTLAGGMTTGTIYQNYLDGRSSGVCIPLGGVRALP